MSQNPYCAPRLGPDIVTVADKMAAVAAEREACAQIVDPPKSQPATKEAQLAKMVRKGLAEAIRARK